MLHLIVSRTLLNCYSKKLWTSLVLTSGHHTAQTNSVDYNVCGVMQQRVYEIHTRMNSVDEVKQRLIEMWKSAAERYSAVIEWVSE